MNVGAPHVDESRFLPELVLELISKYTIPLVVDSSDVNALKTAIMQYPATCLVNSISGEHDKMEVLAPYIKLWGCPTILLPLEGGELPKTAHDRIAIIDKLVAKALSYGIEKHMLVVDVLALTAASDLDAPKAALDTLKYCKEQGLATTVGLSNISFGLPARELINATFLSLASAAGLNSCIGNPSNTIFKQSLDCVNLLLGHDANAESFIEQYADYTNQNSASSAQDNSAKNNKSNEQYQALENAIIKGDKDSIISLLEDELKKGTQAFDIINTNLIPALNIVGEKYERKEYYLPQLLRSAETMQKAFKFLKPMLSQDSAIEKGKIILATVEGDIHDIGKNIVGLVLENHGYTVIDLGKDVKAQTILDEAKKHNVHAVGLSALMTTTMPRMQEFVQLLEKDEFNCKVFIGGAVVTQDYADYIGATAYATDAVNTVRVLENILD